MNDTLGRKLYRLFNRPGMESAAETRAEWLELPEAEREWRIRKCDHPFGRSRWLGQVQDPSRDGHGMVYVVNVRQCLICRKDFIDPGLETPGRKHS